MFLKTVYCPGLAHMSYLVGDGGSAAVIDPKRDCAEYVELAGQEGARITHIIETHRHEDFVSGSMPLASMTGAKIFHGGQLPFRYGNVTREGESFQVGRVRLSILNTPGHSNESLSVMMTDTQSGDDPVAVFTGDTLLVGDVGRTDLNPDPGKAAGQLYDSLFNKLLRLGDHVTVYPAHGRGSACGLNPAKRMSSTIGYERRHNTALLRTDRGEFIRQQLAETPPRPPYFRQMERVNLEGAAANGGPCCPRPQSPDEFAALMEQQWMVLDVREPEAFGGAHVPGSLSLPTSILSAVAGWVVPYDRPIGLVGEDREQVRQASVQLFRMGYDDVACFLLGGVSGWVRGGHRFDTIPAVHVQTLKQRLDRGERLTLLDVRSCREVATQGMLPKSMNLFLGDLPWQLDQIARDCPAVVYDSTGRRAIVAASILQANGFWPVEYLAGSFEAWKAMETGLVREPEVALVAGRR